MIDSVPRRRRNSLRLTGWDYGAVGVYFCTFCTARKSCVLGQAHDGSVQRSALGELVEAHIVATPVLRPDVRLDAWIVMPNHVHLLLALLSETSTGSKLPAIINGLKAAVTAQAREAGLWGQALLWQRGYFDRIVRTEREYDAVRTYIGDNPIYWAQDAENPDPV